MSKFIFVAFPSEAKAYEGTRVLKDLHAEGSLSLYGLAVITKGADGKLAVKDETDGGPIGTAVGTLVGGLTGLLGGPVGATMGLGAGALEGSFTDIFNMGVGADFVDKVSRQLSPGKTAIVAEIDEDWVTPLDVRMAAIGGVVTREWRSDFEDEQIDQEVEARKAEVAQLKDEWCHATGEAKAKLAAKIDEANARYQKASDRLDAQIARLHKEQDAKMAALQKQAATAKADAKAKIDKRISELRVSHKRRTTKLKELWEQTKQALAA
jgi:uncharacterized membrane protein